jgi:hypothetical protein
MHKPALLFSLVLAAGATGALEARSSDTSPSASKPAAPGRELTAEIVAVDTEGRTLTVKGEKENRTLTVAPDAQRVVTTLRPGDTVTLLQNEAGEVTGVKAVGVKPQAVPKS